MLPTGIVDSIEQGYHKLWKAFVQPHKTNYVAEDLGFSVQERLNGFYVREDFFVEVPNSNRRLAVSFYFLMSSEEFHAEYPAGYYRGFV